MRKWVVYLVACKHFQFLYCVLIEALKLSFGLETGLESDVVGEGGKVGLVEVKVGQWFYKLRIHPRCACREPPYNSKWF